MTSTVGGTRRAVTQFEVSKQKACLESDLCLHDSSALVTHTHTHYTRNREIDRELLHDESAANVKKNKRGGGDDDDDGWRCGSRAFNIS